MPVGSLKPGMRSSGATELMAAAKASTDSADAITSDSLSLSSLEEFANTPPKKVHQITKYF